MKSHIFDIEDTIKYGVDCAVMLTNFRFWIAKNKANNVNFYDGQYWTYNSVTAFEKLFPYYSYGQIKRTLKKLEDLGLIKSGNYNKSKYDRTKWYCLNEEPHLTNLANGTLNNSEPIPDVNSNINSDFNNCLPTPEIFKNENEIILIKTEEERKKVAPKKEKIPNFEAVSLTIEEMQKIEERYKGDSKWAIETLHNYKMAKGARYKSDYHVLIGWVYEKYLKEKKPQKIGSMDVSNMPKYDFENIPDPLKDFR